MKVTLERATLLKSLNHVHRVVERRNTIPILSNVLLRAEGGDLVFKATDLDLEVLETAPAMVEVGGATTVPAHMLYDIVRKLPDGSEVTLETNEDQTSLAISAGRSHFTLQILPVTDFPDITAGEFSHTFTIKALDLKRLIDHTQFAISTEETRYYLNGIYVHSIEVDGTQLLRAVATDGHRLAQAQLPAPAGAAGMPGVIVPRKTVSEVQKLIEDPEANIAVELSESKIRLTIGPVVLTSKLIDGTFPDYEKVIPKGNDKAMKVENALFAQAVDRVATVSNERGRAVKLSVESGRLVLSVSNPDSGTATDELAVEYDSEPMEIGFNARYLLDITNQLESDSAQFRLADSGSPTLIQDYGDNDTLYVLMPMRV
ncbi:DNA polymerase III, beta subunit [Cohaesibacter sp. ES.047]|uniref:DNA polymerase III subunit beta n=1 Tax=Cohaesibacter sp. ES.047 TaxID=1798205 RepID=UPI000BB7FF65|nr:DNA polymerase III subunit beta [Cohaesibacter sp. ES.047]SNY90364.1 DNA polymerase III, beta subunit [Cohaesibacter sp. ES.047]